MRRELTVEDFERDLDRLGRQPLDQDLSQLEPQVWSRIEMRGLARSSDVSAAPMWRAAAIGLAAFVGFGTATAASALSVREPAPLMSLGQEIAPSTLLGG